MKNKTTVGKRILIFNHAIFVNSGIFIVCDLAFTAIPNFPLLLAILCALTITVYIARNTYNIWNCENKNTENENRILELEKKIEELTKNK